MARARTVAHPPQGVTASGIDVLDRAAAVLFAFHRDDAPLTLTELAARTGLYKSTLSRIAAALCHHRLLTKLEDGRYQIGPAALRLSVAYEASFHLGDALLPPMRELNAEIGEAVSFHVREGAQRVCLYRIASRRSVRADVQPGDVQPLERGAGGRVLLAFSGEPGELYDEVRRRYVYMSIGERDPETAGLSAPVFDARGQLVGALGIVAPVSRMGRAEMEQYRPRLLHFAARITESLGGNAAPLREVADERGAQAAAEISGV